MEIVVRAQVICLHPLSPRHHIIIPATPFFPNFWVARGGGTINLEGGQLISPILIKKKKVRERVIES